MNEYLTTKEAAEIEGVTVRSIERALKSHLYPHTQLGDSISKNGKRTMLIHITSLSIAAQVRFYQREEAANPQPGSALKIATEADIMKAIHRQKLVEQASDIKEKWARSKRLRTVCGPKPEIEALAVKNGITYAHLQKWGRDFRTGGFASLLPKRGTVRKSHFDRRIKEAIQSDWLRQHRPSPQDVSVRISAWCMENSLPAPGYRTVCRIIDQIPVSVAKYHRDGREDWLSRYAPKGKRDMSAIAVNEWWNSDHREFDCFIQVKNKVYRPWLTSWMDMRSRKIVGYAICIKPNSRTIALAFRKGVLSHGRPKHLYIDNGKDYVCHYLNGKKEKIGSVSSDIEAQGVFGSLSCQVHHAIPYSAWSKPIERWHRNIKKWERTLPGWCGKDNKDRPAKLEGEIKKGKLLSLEDFSGLFVSFINEYNNTIHSQLEGQTPEQMYEGVVREIPDERVLDLMLMKHPSRMIGVHGIKVFPGTTYHYYAHELGPLIGSRVTVRYDPGEIGRAFIFTDKGTKFLCVAENQKLLTMKATEEDFKENAKKKTETGKRIRAFREEKYQLSDNDTVLAAIIAAKDGKGVFAETPELIEKRPPIRLITGMDKDAKAIEKAVENHESLPDPPEESDLDLDTYNQRMADQLELKRMEREAKQEAWDAAQFEVL